MRESVEMVNAKVSWTYIGENCCAINWICMHLGESETGDLSGETRSVDWHTFSLCSATGAGVGVPDLSTARFLMGGGVPLGGLAALFLYDESVC